jgi:hypothetical protein
MSLSAIIRNAILAELTGLWEQKKRFTQSSRAKSVGNSSR